MFLVRFVDLREFRKGFIGKCCELRQGGDVSTTVVRESVVSYTGG